LLCQKRPITVSKETYYSVKRQRKTEEDRGRQRKTEEDRNCYVKRDLLQCQKRPITVSKETYYSVTLRKTAIVITCLLSVVLMVSSR
jgi:hypothetical protein